MAEVLSGRSREPTKWVTHGLSNPVVYGALLYGGTRLPAPILRGISLVGNTLAVALMRRTVSAVADNFEKALGVSPSEARPLAKELFFEYGRTVVDLWRCRSGRADLAPRITTLESDAVFLKRRVAGGRGFLLVSGHVGNWEMGAVALNAIGLRPAVLGQPELDPAVHRMRLSIRRRLGVDSIETGSTISTALRVRDAVEAGQIVALAADRASDEDRVMVPFFGRPTPFLRSPALLARFCKCEIVPCFFLRNRDGTYRGVFRNPIRSSESRSPEEDARRVLSAVASAVESAVREEPTQWFNFYKYWE